MILLIDKNWRISTDKYNWKLDKSRTRNGKRCWETVGWFVNLDSAIRELGERLVRTSDVETLAEALVEVDRIATRLSRALTPCLQRASSPTWYYPTGALNLHQDEGEE